jgi:selenocysteine lyase/cysteine desulfurase
MSKQTFDVARARRETPGCIDLIHFNNAGAALMPKRVVQTLLQYTQLEAKIGGYEAAEKESKKIENLYQVSSRLLNCKATEIAFVESATRGWDMAFYSIPFSQGDVILTGMSEYESNYLAFLQVAQKAGVRVEVIPNDENGQISLKVLQEKVSKKVKLIAITHIPTNGGLVNPAEEIGKIAKAAGILYLLDSCQAAGQIPLDVQKLNCDFLSFTGRKYIRGPRGTGILYVRESVCHQLEPPFLDLQAAEWISNDRYTLSPGAQRFEQWETNVGAKIGLGVAIDYALTWGIDKISNRIVSLATDLRRLLSEIPEVQLCDLGLKQCGIVSFRVKNADPTVIQRALRLRSINTSVSMKRYTRLDMDSRKFDSVCRASVHYYNTEKEIERFCMQLRKIIKNL